MHEAPLSVCRWMPDGVCRNRACWGRGCIGERVSHNPVSHRPSHIAASESNTAEPAVESDGGTSNRAPDGRA